MEDQPADQVLALTTRRQLEVIGGPQPTSRRWSEARPGRRLDYFLGSSSTSSIRYQINEMNDPGKPTDNAPVDTYLKIDGMKWNHTEKVSHCSNWQPANDGDNTKEINDMMGVRRPDA